MERRLQKLILIPILLSSLLFAQDVSQERMVRFALWASTEIYPGVEKPESDILAMSARKIKDISLLILSGMIYGWEFEYVPYDKARGVEEYFQFTPLRELSKEEVSTINFTKPWIENNILNCWIEYRRTDDQLHIYKGWQSIVNAKIKGEGFGKLSDGFDGIQSACAEALKYAVRNYQRKWIKTKPKEIRGRVFMHEPPKIGVSAGRYKVTLDFFMETDKIIEYKTF
ncbi:MAG: hypothetical protein K5873_06595 [Treponema sp.]|nr:hypothetical protein [Treponema sp.]